MPDSFAEALASQATVKGPSCTLGILRLELPARDRTELDAALADSSIPHTHIARALAAIGHKVLDGTVGRHRNGDCQCPSATS